MLLKRALYKYFFWTVDSTCIYQTIHYNVHVNIYSLQANASDPRLWSEISTASVRTLPKIPSRPPQTAVGSFEIVGGLQVSFAIRETNTATLCTDSHVYTSLHNWIQRSPSFTGSQHLRLLASDRRRGAERTGIRLHRHSSQRGRRESQVSVVHNSNSSLLHFGCMKFLPLAISWILQLSM